MYLTKSKSAYIGPYSEEGGADGIVVGGTEVKVGGATGSDTGFEELVFFFF